jgi:predicted transcriptional regulator
MQSEKFNKAIQLFDEANSSDPNTEIFEGKEFPKELLYAMRMTEQLNKFAPNSSEALQLTVRCQHICRWEIPRDSYEMNRVGYLNWRKDLKDFHAKKASEILKSVGYNDEVIDDVSFLLLKKQLKKNADTQTLEDVICLVFLDFYFLKFSEKYSEEKLIDIVQKTWKKMSDKGHKAALELNLPASALALITKALS